jgi:hypothetical protein
MRKKLCAVAAVVLFAVAGCSGGDDSKGSTGAKPKASKEYSQEAEDCFVGVIKALNLVLGKAEGKDSGSDEEAEFAEFGVNASGTPTWDIYNTYMQMGVRDIAQGRQPTAVDAIATYAPSVKLECVRAYG